MADLGHTPPMTLSASGTNRPVAGNSIQEGAGDDLCLRQPIDKAVS